MATDEDVEGSLLTDQSRNVAETYITEDEHFIQSDKERAPFSFLKECLKNEDRDGFVLGYKSRFERHSNEIERSEDTYEVNATEISTFLQFLDDDDEGLGRAVQYLKENDIFVIHDLLYYTDNVDNVRFLENKTHLLKDFELDSHKRTWLHAVVGSDCDPNIIAFVKDNLGINPNRRDDDGNTALHVFCVNVTQEDFFCYILWNSSAYNKNVERIIPLLSGKDGCVLMIKNNNGQSPLEMACHHKFLFSVVNSFLKIEPLLENANMLGKCFEEIKLVKVPDSMFSPLIFWKSVLRENNRTTLIAYMKDVERFEKKYVMEENDFNEIYLHYLLFGKGHNKLTKNVKALDKTKYKLSDAFGFPGVGDFHFYRSAPFLALITGRWNLVMPLVAFSRFDVVPYCLLTCAVCVKMKQWRNVTGRLRQKLNEIHQSADSYLTEIINSIYDGNSDYDLVCDYLTQCNSLFNGLLMDVGYFANCKKYFNTFACQTVLSTLWRKKHANSLGPSCACLGPFCLCLSPFHKFVLHSMFHIVFILCLFSVLLMERCTQIGGLEIFCYLYGIGYFIEEGRQMLYYYRVKQLTRYFYDATNIIDLFGLGSFLIAFGLRCSLSVFHGSVDHMEWHNKKAFRLNFYAYFFLSITSVLLSVRWLFFLSVFKTFGSKLKMIERMIVIDLIPVAVIFFVFIISFGVSFQSLMFPGFPNATIVAERNSTLLAERFVILLAEILWRPTLTIFEPKYIIDEAEETKSQSIQYPLMNLAVQFLLIMFIIIVSVMLMNMLIALFSETVSDISLTAEESWAIDKWKLIREYTKKSFSVPPLNIIEIVMVVMKSFCGSRTFTECKRKKTDIKKGDIHPFIILFLLKENRFELLAKIEAQRMSDNAMLITNLLRHNVANLEEMLNNRRSSLSR